MWEMTYPKKALEVYATGIQGTVEMVYRVLDRVIFSDEIDQPVVVRVKDTECQHDHLSKSQKAEAGIQGRTREEKEADAKSKRVRTRVAPPAVLPANADPSGTVNRGPPPSEYADADAA